MLVIIRFVIVLILVYIVSYHIPPKCCKEKEPKVEQLCIAVHTINNNIQDADPLDNFSNKAQLTKQYLT